MDVKTCVRTVGLFEIFARTRTPLSLTELARELGSPLSSCMYLVRTLERRGYVYQVGSRYDIYPSRKLFGLATSILAGEVWMERIEPLLVQLRDATQETIILGKRQRNEVIYVAVIEGSQTIRYTAQAGDLKPLHSSSIGKALLSWLPVSERVELVSKLGLERVTPATITDRTALLADLEHSAERGYAMTRGENVADVMAIAKPLRLGPELYAICVAGPIHRMEKEVETHLTRLTEICAKLTGNS